MSILEKTLWAVLVIIVGLGTYWGFVQGEFFTDRFMMEDGVVEYATVGVLIAACTAVFLRWLKYRGHHNLKFDIISWIVILGFLFVAGEEVSWGQRIFNLETTEYFKENNAQEEINLHNLTVGGVKINKLVFGLILTTVIIVYMVLIPLLYHQIAAFKRILDRWFIPLPEVRHSIGYIILLGLISLIPAGKNWELLEFGSVLIFLLVLLFPNNKRILEPPNSL